MFKQRTKVEGKSGKLNSFTRMLGKTGGYSVAAEQCSIQTDAGVVQVCLLEMERSHALAIQQTRFDTIR